MKDPHLLFLTLKTFSSDGGIERVNRILAKLVNDTLPVRKYIFSSLYDVKADSRYIDKNFFAFKNNRIYFFLHTLYHALFSDIVWVTHINLALVIILIKQFRPSCKVILMAHGIEVWRPLSGIQKLALHKSDLIVSVSSYTKKRIQDLHAIQESKFRVLNHCIDPLMPLPDSFERDEALSKKYGIRPGTKTLFTLSRLSFEEQYKGYDQVIEVLPELKKSFPDIKYLIAGKYHPKEKERIENIIEAKGLKENVYIVGFIQEADLQSYYSLSDIFVMPSKEEGFGLVFIEAMAHGIPVIAGNIDGSADALKQGDLGILVNPEKSDELVQAISSLLKDKQALRGKELQKKTLSYFHYDRYKQNFKSIIEEVNG